MKKIKPTGPYGRKETIPVRLDGGKETHQEVDFRDKNGKWRRKYLSSNGNVILQVSEPDGYERWSTMDRAVRLLMEAWCNGTIAKHQRDLTRFKKKSK